ncbi:hypothetical protein [Pseudoteredinibacter isoporae]|uniref:hypothetical protein n=1 Tax=Pseudoteredinibacter isoporae TaxID=570281 RepID=UPI00310677F3
MDYQNATVLEYVEFQCLSDIPDHQVLDALDETLAILDETEGFVYRHIAKRNDIWVELVFWNDRDSANTGLEKFNHDARSQKLLAMIDRDSVSIRYSNLQQSTPNPGKPHSLTEQQQ